ncbi:hypothetical protein Tco_0371802 [Tanacetum coccineum]
MMTTIRLEEQINEEQRAQIARDEEIARQWDEEERKRAMAEAKFGILIKILSLWMQSMEVKKQKSPEKIVEEEVDTQEEMKEVVKEPGAKRKKSIPKKAQGRDKDGDENAEKRRTQRIIRHPYQRKRDIDEIEEVNVNCISMENLQQASTSGTQNKAPVYDLDGSAEVHHYENCYNNDIFNMFTQEEEYNDLLEDTSEPPLVQQEDRNVIPVDTSLDPSGGEVEHQTGTVEETRAFFESLYNNLVTKVENVNTVNRKIKDTNADLNTELARYRGQEKSFEINKTKFDELETSYRKSVYQEQCLTKKINALYLSSAN